MLCSSLSEHFQLEQAIIYLLYQKRKLAKICPPSPCVLCKGLFCQSGWISWDLPSQRLSVQILWEFGWLSLCYAEAPWAIPWACWAILLFSSMKRSGRNVLMNKSLTFQHLHLEGSAGWVVMAGLWKAHWCALYAQKGPTGADLRPPGAKSFFIDSLGLGLSPSWQEELRLNYHSQEDLAMLRSS